MNGTLFIDGYNVINAWPMLKKYKEQELELSRDKLLDALAGYGKYSGYNVIVVFDANEVSGSLGSEYYYADMKVVFTKEGETADSYIEKNAYILVRTGECVYVVTSDYAEQQAILWAGAYRMPARELINNCLALKNKLSEIYGIKKDGSARNELEARLNDNIAKELEKIRRRRS